MKRCVFILAAATALAGCTTESDGEGGERVVISAECEWYFGAECEVACQTTDFDIYCEGGCDGNIDLPECQLDCEGSCQADCDIDPSAFSCEGYCGGECSASCEGDCAASADQASCEGECSAYCDGECSASCEGLSDVVDCEGSCSASCEGGCSGGDIDFSCYLDCQIESPIECEGSCDADGFLECNGEFIDRRDLESAVEWVRDNMTAEVTYEGDAECHGSSCSAEGSASIECAVGSPGAKGGPVGTIVFLLAVIATFFIGRCSR